ncbi:MAG: ACT domain-containing protein [Reichenbachiella sp.]
MTGETNLSKLIQEMSPRLNEGEYVFSKVNNLDEINRNDTIGEFQEDEGTTVIIEKYKADNLGLEYNFVASWITLIVHSSLNAVGLTAAFSTELAKDNISCNVMAGYYHDHIFVNKIDDVKAMTILESMSSNYK